MNQLQNKINTKFEIIEFIKRINFNMFVRNKKWKKKPLFYQTHKIGIIGRKKLIPQVVLSLYDMTFNCNNFFISIPKNPTQNKKRKSKLSNFLGNL